MEGEKRKTAWERVEGGRDTRSEQGGSEGKRNTRIKEGESKGRIGRERERESEKEISRERGGAGGGLEGESVGGRERKITRGKLSASPPAWSDICSSTQTERA